MNERSANVGFVVGVPLPGPLRLCLPVPIAPLFTDKLPPGQGSPPEDTYSVDTHPERFAPPHTVAEALIGHLRETYDVESTRAPRQRRI